MELKLKGKTIEVSDTQQITESLKKRRLVIEVDENQQFSYFVEFEAANDKCALLDSVQIGVEVEVFFNIRGRRYTDKTGKVGYFNSLQIWRVIINGSAKAPEQPKAQEVAADDNGDDGLPF